MNRDAYSPELGRREAGGVSVPWAWALRQDHKRGREKVEEGRRHHEVGESCKHGHEGKPIRARAAQAEHGRLELGVIDKE